MANADMMVKVISYSSVDLNKKKKRKSPGGEEIENI